VGVFEDVGMCGRLFQKGKSRSLKNPKNLLLVKN